MKTHKKITFVQALLTAIGLVIGSGIFFRADNILIATEGNPATAVLGWVTLGLTLIFAGISVAVLAERTNKRGGLVAYMEDAYGKKAAFLAGWFQSVVYIPVLIGVLGIVAVNFMIDLFNLELAVGEKYLLVAVTIIVVFIWNFLSTKFAAMFSSFATIIKVLPLIVIAIFGLVFGHGDTAILVDGMSQVGTPLVTASEVTREGVNLAGLSGLALFTAPLLSMAFAFDGWITVGTLSHDMEDPKKNLPKVFALNAIIVTVVYTAYFAAVTTLMSPAEIINAGDSHVGIIANDLFGATGEKLVLTAVIISVLGTLNGNVMGGLRYPQALAEEGEMPNSKFFRVINPKTGTPVNGGIFTVCITVVYFFLYFLQEKTAGSANPLFSGIGFDDIPIMLNAVFYILLFIAVVNVGRKEKLGVLRTWIAPIIATIGQAFVIVSFFTSNPNAPLYLAVSVVVILAGLAIKNLGNKGFVK